MWHVINKGLAPYFDDSLSSPMYKMRDGPGPVENRRSKYGTFYFDNFPDVLFCPRTWLPVPHATHCTRPLRRAPASDRNRSDAYFIGGRSKPAAPSEPQPVYVDALIWMESNQPRGRAAPQPVYFELFLMGRRFLMPVCFCLCTPLLTYTPSQICVNTPLFFNC